MNFYYDETFHDRKITQNDEGVLNSYLGNSNDCFIYALVGFENEDKIKDSFFNLEKRIKDSLGIDENELKSTTFKKENFKYGLKSMKNHCKDFYFNYLDLIIENKIIYQIGMISKTEFILNNFFCSLRVPDSLGVKPESFIYSLTKFIDRHRLNYLFSKILNSSKDNLIEFKTKIEELLDIVEREIKDIPREKSEIIAIQNMKIILKESSIERDCSIKNEWNYSIIAAGVKRRLNELNKINSVVYVDNEKNTCDAFKKAEINAVELDSKESLMIRLADMFVGFVGRTVFALNDDLKEPDIKEYKDIKKEAYLRKRLLSNEWFNIDEQTFELYKRIAAFMDKSGYWASFTTQYFDNAVLFFSLFHYIDSYESYADFFKKSSHNELFNTFCCRSLEEKFHN